MSGNPLPFDPSLTRRDLLQAMVSAGLVTQMTGAASADSPSSGATNPIIQENKKEGSLDWQSLDAGAFSRGGGYQNADIEGYCSQQSVKAGETLDIFVSTNPPRPFQIEIFRTGYYGGRGARLMTTLGPFTGKAQSMPVPGVKNLHECRWEKSASITIPEDWVSGVYLGRLSLIEEDPAKGYWQSYIVFIVTDDRPADILLQCSDNTWQAYNRWPSHYSVYTDPKGNQGPWADVSFDHRTQSTPRSMRTRSPSVPASGSASSSRWGTGWSRTDTTWPTARTAIWSRPIGA